MNKKIIALVIILLAIFLVLNFLKTSAPKNIKHVEIGGQTVQVDLAFTDAEQELGLSGRESLPDNSGMLFVFGQPGFYPFWMKDMNFPIDMIWIGENMRVVYIKKNAVPQSYPESFVSDQEARYVLEVPAGFSEKNRLMIGDSVLFTYR